MPPEFLYFDLGKVLLDFSIERMCRQMGDVAGVDPAKVREVLYPTAALPQKGLEYDYECGRVSSRQFYERFCQRTGSRPDFDALLSAGNDIFSLNLSLVPVVGQLAAAGHRMGILSNTNQGHWDYCRDRYRLLTGSFSVFALSFRIGACKPDAAIFRAAAELALSPPERIFYVDDIAGHVAGARSLGFDAVQYTSTPELVAELRRRGVEFNY
jgi:HAD superfamily hydrolase (TIGR01509 family)